MVQFWTETRDYELFDAKWKSDRGALVRQEHLQGYKRAEIKAIVGMHAKEGYNTPRTASGSSADQGDSLVYDQASHRAADVLRLGGLSADEVTIMEGVFACGKTKARDCVVPFLSPMLYMLPAEAGPRPHPETPHTVMIHRCSIHLCFCSASVYGLRISL
eukprot:COSAG02_NODE_6708_length_3407_cov_3.645103_3_plen_160_part_00